MRTRIFDLVIVGCLGFVVLTALAMLVYPGGTGSDAMTRGYSFFTNFFSDLGRTQARNGEPNTMAAPLFFIALSGAGAVLIAFSVAFARFFTRTRLDRALATLGALAGVVAGACFIGVAFTPANGGKSGLDRMRRRLTAGGGFGDGTATDSATESKPPWGFGPG